MLIRNENGRILEPLLRHYSNIFGAYYNKPIQFNETTVATVLRDIIDTVDVAENLGSVSVVQKPIESVLSKQNQVLWRSMESNPAAWTDLCYRIRSEYFFGEALKFLAGKWGLINKDIKKHMSEEVRRVAKRKSAALKANCRDVDARLAALYHGSLTRSENDDHTRSSYANDIMIWMALGFFRHWFRQAIARENGSSCPDRGHTFYQRLATGGDAYLDREALNHFYQRFAMSKKGMHVIENHILEIKKLVKGTVKRSNILSNNTQLDTSRHAVEYLLCTEISKDDIPWLRRPDHHAQPLGIPSGSNSGSFDSEEPRNAQSRSIDNGEDDIHNMPAPKRARRNS